ncbi:MAG: CoB--CoM heterodisulfide reductase iron-sulfur subunit A family protein [Bacillota bacterium]
MSQRRIGVYICHCGGNISDYVDVQAVLQAVRDEPGVAVAKTAQFTCSDATQQEMIQDIREQQLDGLVVASCSPKLHLHTFRDVARRAGLNPYQYTQVNIREQCSWAHTDDPAGATEKAIRLVRAGIARTGLTRPLEPLQVDTVPRVLILGAGVAGLRAALALADVGLTVFLLEKEERPGGHVAALGTMYPHGVSGKELVKRLLDEVGQRASITLLTRAELVEKKGSMGDFQAKVRVGGAGGREMDLQVGAIIVATGFDTYRPPAGEYGFGSPGVVTLEEFNRLLEQTGDQLTIDGRPVHSMAYIHCVGAGNGAEAPVPYCSRYCCNAAAHAAARVAQAWPQVSQYHFYRDLRTYGRYEMLATAALQAGSVFIRFPEDEPPQVQKQPGGRLTVAARDLLTAGDQVAVPVDLVVLVTGMVPRADSALVEALKLPLGRDGFYSEIHPKLRPVETVVDGVYICGSCQGPKNSAESVTSALAAAAQCAALLKKGHVELEPLVVTVHPERCTGCGDCLTTCPYTALEQSGSGAPVQVNRALCKGCGGCVPLCPQGALDLEGYSDAQLTVMIDALLKESKT